MGQLIKFLVTLVVVYVLISGSFLIFRKQLIYLFEETGAPPADMPRTDMHFLPQTPEDPALQVWVTRPLPGKPVILYFMGGTGSLSVHEPRLRIFAEAGFGVAAMAYRGGGGQAGRPSEVALGRDAARLYDSLDTLFGQEILPDDRVIYGFGLGSGLAVRLAADTDEMALILEAPFSSMCELAERRFPFLPACRVMWDERYDNAGLIGRVDTTLFFLHGAEDGAIPLDVGRALFVAAPEPKFYRIYARGGHEDLPRFGALTDAIRFINTLRGEI